MSGSSDRSTTAPPDGGEQHGGALAVYATESSEEQSGPECRAAPPPAGMLAPPAEASLARRLSRCEMDIGLDVIEEDGACEGRRCSDAEVMQLDALHYRLSLYLNDPEPQERRRESLRVGRPRHRVSRRNSELLPRPAGSSVTLCRRHSVLTAGAGVGAGGGNRRPSRRHSRRPSLRPGSRTGSCVGSTRRLHSEACLSAEAGLLPSGELEPKERRRRQVVLAVMAGAFIIVSMSVGLIFVMLYLTSSEGTTDGVDVRKENEEIYRGLKPVFNQTTPASTTDGGG